MNGSGDGGVVTEEKRLGQVVQTARREAGLTQQALCQKSGLSYSTLAKIERGAIKSPSIFTIQHIASTLGISLDRLLQDVPAHRTAITATPTASKKVSRGGIRFVYFDMNGCLVRFNNSPYNRLAEEAGVTPDVVESVYWQFHEDVNRGTKSMDELNTALAERLHMMVDWNKYYLEAVEATPGMLELVEWVAENYHIGILSNTSANLVEPMLKSGTLPGVNYDAIVQSCEVHSLKPEAQMFEIAAERAGVAPNEILLIDDDRPNLAGAQRSGWHTMKFDGSHPEESIVSISTALEPAE